MKNIYYITLLLIVFSLCSSCDLEGIEEVEAEQLTVFDVLNRQNRFNQFLNAAQKANLLNLLQGSDSYTWFIPNDSAFADLSLDINALSADELRSILEYHIIPNKQFLVDLPQGYQSTIAGDSFWINANINELTGSAARLDLNQFRNETLFNNYNINASNGRINEISFVLVPPNTNLWQLIQSDSGLSSFVELVNKAGLSSLLQGTGPLTIFAPDNEAFTGIDIDALTITEARVIVNDHIINSEPFYADDLENSMSIANVNDNQLSFDEGTVNDIQIKEVDLTGINGVVHIIDNVIIF